MCAVSIQKADQFNIDLTEKLSNNNGLQFQLYDAAVNSEYIEFKASENYSVGAEKHKQVGVYAIADIVQGTYLPLQGILSKCDVARQQEWDDHFSLMTHEGHTHLLLGPLSYVHHSCSPNAEYVQRNQNIVVRTLK